MKRDCVWNVMFLKILKWILYLKLFQVSCAFAMYSTACLYAVTESEVNEWKLAKLEDVRNLKFDDIFRYSKISDCAVHIWGIYINSVTVICSERSADNLLWWWMVHKYGATLWVQYAVMGGMQWRDGLLYVGYILCIRKPWKVCPWNVDKAKAVAVSTVQK